MGATCSRFCRNFAKLFGSFSAVSRAILKLIYWFGVPNSDPQTLKVLISGVSFRHCSLSQSHESEVLSYSECKIAKIFQDFAPGPHWGQLTVPKMQWLKCARHGLRKKIKAVFGVGRKKGQLICLMYIMYVRFKI